MCPTWASPAALVIGGRLVMPVGELQSVKNLLLVRRTGAEDGAGKTLAPVRPVPDRRLRSNEQGERSQRAAEHKADGEEKPTPSSR